MNEVKRDTQFAQVIITDTQGNKRTAYLYKPQNLVCTNYVTVELLKSMGCKIEEVAELPLMTPQEPIDYKAQYESLSKKAEVIISQLRADRDRLENLVDEIRTEIEQEPYISKMEVLDILDKYKGESV